MAWPEPEFEVGDPVKLYFVSVGVAGKQPLVIIEVMSPHTVRLDDMGIAHGVAGLQRDPLEDIRRQHGLA